MDLPYFSTVDNRVGEVNEQFLKLTGYTEEDFLGKGVEEIWRPLLRINTELGKLKCEHACSCYLFDINHGVKDVLITYFEAQTPEHCIYTFELKKNDILEEKFPFLELTNSANDTGLAICSVPDFILLKANKSYMNYFSDLFGVSKDMLGICLGDSAPGWKNSEPYNIFMGVVNSGKPAYYSEIHMGPPEKGPVCTRATITPVFEGGCVKYVTLIHNDVTEKVENRRALLEKSRIVEEQKKRLEAILETVSKSIVLCVFDRDGRFVGGDSLVENLFVKYGNINSLKASYGAGVYFDELGNEIPFEDLPISRVLKGEVVSGYKLTIKLDDSIAHYVVNGTPIIDSRGDFHMGIICGWDITERIRYQQLLETQRDYLLQVFNSLDLPILYLTYPDLKVIGINKKVIELLKEIPGFDDKISESDIVGKVITEAIPWIKNLGARPFLEQLDKTKNIVCHEKVEINTCKGKVYFNVTYHPVLDLEGNITELLAAAVDVTAEVEKSKHMEEVLKLKDEFLYLMSHEFKTPLTVINAAVQNLEHIYADQIPDKAKAMISRIKQNGYRQLRLVNNLLDITKINAGQIKLRKQNIDIVHLTRVITESVAIYAQQKRVDISFHTKLEYRMIAMDDEKFERVLLNLLSNAIKFTPAGKKVVVQLSSRQYKNRRMICIEVKDQGIGIPKNMQNIIFERFGQVDSLLTRQAEGSGIGLFLVKQIMSALDGEILLDSEEGKGSIFTLLVPAVKMKDKVEEPVSRRFSDGRLIQSIATEFSDIYV